MRKLQYNKVQSGESLLPQFDQSNLSVASKLWKLEKRPKKNLKRAHGPIVFVFVLRLRVTLDSDGLVILDLVVISRLSRSCCC